MSGLVLDGTGITLTGSGGGGGGTADNIAGGAANQVVYQTGAGATGFIDAPSVTNSFLSWSGSVFQWASPSTVLPTILGSGPGGSVSTGTAETQLATVTVPANSMGTTGSLIITTIWSYTNSGNNKTLRVRFGGSAGTAYMAQISTATVTLRSQVQIYNSGAANSQVGGPSGPTFGVASTSAGITSAVDTTASTTVYFSGQTASSGETITLLGYTVTLVPGV